MTEQEKREDIIMTEQEKSLLQQFNSAYNLKRLDDMGKLQNQLVETLTEANLPIQDVLMVLTVLRKQLEEAFISKLKPVQEKTDDSTVEKTDV